MDSKKKPLMLFFNCRNSEETNIVMFKEGDDLRQDILTLQILEVIDQIWNSEGIDLQLHPYNCISTGDEEGLIQIVEHGGGAMGALREHTIDTFLQKKNPDPVQLEIARKNFVVTCAGYCVATYVLGIGDRHSSNIMLKEDGSFFHIDFGHFLGNFKSKIGIKRERTPFAFTPEMAYAMGGKKYESSHLFEKFKLLCCKAFLVLRKHHVLLVDLMKLMIPAGIPELSKVEDIKYMTDMLKLNKTEKEAKEALLRDIKMTLNAISRKFDNLIHNIKHR